MTDMLGELVQLYVYDLSGGMARAFSPMLLGKQIDGVWHSSIVISGVEHYFGRGISMARAGSTPFGRPVQILDLGYTQLPEDIRSQLLVEMSEQFSTESYSLFNNNCNNFANEFANLLVGVGIPNEIVGLPLEVLSTPFGQMIQPLLAGLEAQLGGVHQQIDADTTYVGNGFQQQQQQQQQQGPSARPSVPSTSRQAVDGNGGDKEQEPQPQEEKPSDLAHAAQEEIEVAVAEGMMKELELKEQQEIDTVGTEDGDKISTERHVQQEYERLMSQGQLSEHDAKAAALENVAHSKEYKNEQSPSLAAASPVDENVLEESEK